MARAADRDPLLVRKRTSGRIRPRWWIVLLVSAVGVGALVYVYEPIGDRVRYFLRSRTGQTVSQIMGWSVEFDLPPLDIPEAEMSEEERDMKRRLEDLVRRGRPTHRMVLTSGEELTGKVLEVTRDHVRFMESYGSSGVMAARISRGRVGAIDQIADRIPPIVYRDIRLQMEFPSFEFYLRPPYTVVTDENYFRVQRSVQILRRLHATFMDTFGSLVTRPERGQGIQLLFFEEEEMYREYANTYAPLLEHSSGFYSPRLDRLTVFNQITSDQLKDAKGELKRRERLYRRRADTRDDYEQLRRWRNDAERSILHHAEEQTLYTLRHEGTHQLLFTYGVHSEHHAENSWLIEGIPVYCEGLTFGEMHRERVAILKAGQQSGDFIPLAELVNSRSPKGLFAFGREERVHLAYSEAWVLVHFLMQPKYRNRFFQYIRFIRDVQNLDTLSARSHADLLAEFLNTDPAGLDRAWQIYVQRM